MKFLLALLFPITSWASNCNEVQVKIIFDKKPVVTKETLCSEKTPDSMVFYVSKSCVDKKCEILKRKKEDLTIKNYTGNMGSPGFKLCSELGGVPQIFEFAVIGSTLWQSTDRCLFEKDFVEISLLSREWKSFIKKQY